MFTQCKDAPAAEPTAIAEMREFAAELARQGKLRRGAPLVAESAGARVRVRDGEALVIDGPFTDTKETLDGFLVVDVTGREEAIDIAQRCPHVRRGTVEVALLQARYSFADTGRETPFLLAFRMEEGLCDPDGAKMREMVAFAEGLGHKGTLVETAPLTHALPPARVETRGGKILVTDGPFAETKEGVGGYSVVRVADRAAAIDLAKRYPHATWGPVEVRQIINFNPT